ncbi:MAG: geranylgeranyl reductase family protein [Gemmatimonadota bacterium]|nr:geranylgeranyl reductase family protein [Gemmatimonadota bacterium]
MTAFDALVVGAGPAGSAAAALLARAGARVALLDRAAFPRPKACAEYLSPEAGRVLAALGVLEAVRREPHARLTGMRIVSPAGISVVGRFGVTQGFRPFTPYGIAIRRERLDGLLVERAAALGAHLYERTSAEEMRQAGTGLEVVARGGTRRIALRAPLVIGADGLHSRVARWLGVVRRGRRRRVALVTHAANAAAMTDVGEMHVGADGYVGLAPVGEGLTNIAVVVDARRVPPAPTTRARLAALLARFPAVEARLRGARFVSPVRAVGPFARWTTRATADHVLLVGDAADFYDPFTGEGIFAALRGAELAVPHALAALAAGRFAAGDLCGYDRARHRTFRGKWLLERAIGLAVAHPRVLDHVAARLARRPALADLLVGATGDFVPAGRVLRPAVLTGLVA